MAKTKAQIEFEAVTSGFNSGIQSMDQSLGTLRKELKLNSTELKGNADDVDLLSKRKDILQQESEASAEKVDLLSKKLQEAERLFGTNSKEVQQLNNKLLDAKTVYQGIQNEITQTDNKMDQLKNETKKLGDSMKDAENATQDLEGGFSVLKGAVADLLADGVSKLTEGLKNLAIESDTSMGQFQAETGLSASEMEKFQSVIEETYSKNFGESISDIADAMAEVKQQTKETDPTNLQKMTENALMLRDTFDMDVSESMRAINSLMNQFGLDSTDAFNLVVQGAQNGLNANGDMLDVVNEYSVQFKNAGYSADDMFNMLYNGAETGTWSIDKMGDAVKEFNIRFSDGTVEEALSDYGIKIDDVAERFNKGGQSSQDAINEVIASIMSVDNETERYKLGVSAFGTMWEDLGEDTIVSLMKTEGGISSTKQSMEELTEIKMDNITTQLGEIGRGLQNDFLIPLAEDLLPVLKDMFSWLKDNMNWLLPTIVGIGTALATYFVVSKFMSFIGVVKNLIGLVKSGTTIMGALNTVMALNPIALIVAAIVGLIAVFVLLWNKCDGFREFWLNLWEIIKSAFSTAIEGVKTGIKAVGEFFQNLWVSIQGLWESAKGVFSSIGSWINDNVVQPVINFFKGLWDGIKAVWDGIVFAVKFAFNLIVAIIDAAFQLITLPFRFIWENCKETVMIVFNAIKDYISNVINNIKNVITIVFNAIKTFFTTVWNGIKNVFTTVWNAIVNFITPIINTIKSIITTVFNAVKNTITTIFNAIKNTITTVWNAIKSAISSVINTIKSIITTVFNAIKSFVGNVWEGIKIVIINPIKNAYNTVKSTIGNIKDNIVNTFNNVKSAIQKPIEKARDLVKNAIDKIKGFFNFSFKWPKIKMPKFGISPSGWKVGDLLKGSIPKLSITWNKEGAIFKKPTIFDTQYGFQGVGEAGSEAILPIEKLENWMNNGFNQITNGVSHYVGDRIERLIEIAEEILDKPTDIYMDKNKVGQALAETNDTISGQRINFRNRGVII